MSRAGLVVVGTLKEYRIGQLWLGHSVRIGWAILEVVAADIDQGAPKLASWGRAIHVPPTATVNTSTSPTMRAARTVFAKRSSAPTDCHYLAGGDRTLQGSRFTHAGVEYFVCTR